MFHLTFLSKTFGAMTQPAVKITVDRLRYEMPGGPSEARAYAAGDIRDLVALANLLRNPVQIWDGYGEVVWWGYLAALQVGPAAWDLADLANRLKVGYKFVVDQGSGTVVNQFYTAAANDLGSQADYGIKEKVIASTAGTLAIATAKRDQALARLSKPAPKYRPGDSQAAVLIFRGWFGTLDWLSYANSAGLEGYAVDGTGVQAFGDAAATTGLRMGCTAAVSGWTCDTIWIRCCKIGSPADAVNILVYDYNDSQLLSSGQVGTAGITQNDYTWTKFAITAFTIPAAAIWFRVWRTGGIDGTNYYKVKMNETAGYPRGAFQMWNGSYWYTRSPDASMNFTLVGKAETTAQIASVAAAAACGQFIRTVRIEDASGLYSSPYRSGSKTGLQEVKDLLAVGTSAAGELQAEVQKDRTLRVFAKPVTSHLLMKADGRILTENGLPARPEGICGQWIKIDLPGMDVIDKQFITRVEVDAAGKIQIGY